MPQSHRKRAPTLLFVQLPHRSSGNLNEPPLPRHLKDAFGDIFPRARLLRFATRITPDSSRRPASLVRDVTQGSPGTGDHSVETDQPSPESDHAGFAVALAGEKPAQ